MKKTIYIFTVILLISCKSIDKMIESGNYDDALRYGVDKLRGEKNKKTKYVKGLEEAYERLNNDANNQIAKLQLTNRSDNYDRIVDIYKLMEKRQNYVLPLLPLISENGYLADIKIIDYSMIINKASIAASEAHYLDGIKQLNRAKESVNKQEARTAYEHFVRSQFYFPDYKDSYKLKQEAFELGQTRILLETYVQGSNLAFEHTLEILNQIDINKLNNRWEKYYIHDNGETKFNYIATIEVNNIAPGKERERIHSYVETKEIIEGTIPIKDNKGNIVKDTSGNTLYTDKVIQVSAYIEEIEREKIAQLFGRLVIINSLDNQPINSIPINTTYEFRDYSCRFTGDKRALTQPTQRRLKNTCNAFPTDFEIISQLAYAFKSETEFILYKQHFK